MKRWEIVLLAGLNSRAYSGGRESINLTTKAIPDENFLTVGVSGGIDTVTTGKLGYTYYGSTTDWLGYDGGERKLKVVWDPGNGSGSEITKLLAGRLPGEHFVINGDVDGSFPNHHPDPTVAKNLEQLIAEVARSASPFARAVMTSRWAITLRRRSSSS